MFVTIKKRSEGLSTKCFIGIPEQTNIPKIEIISTPVEYNYFDINYRIFKEINKSVCGGHELCD